MIAVGTWGVGHFDNDSAADFAAKLDEAELAEREALVRGVLLQTADATGYLVGAQDAVAAAALIAAQCPGGEPIEPGEGPEQPMPAFTEDLRALAAEALDRVIGDVSLADAWVAPADGAQWLAGLWRLRSVLAPSAFPDVPLFEIG
jgi:hypothetical protein